MKSIPLLLFFLSLVINAQQASLKNTLPLKADVFIGVDSYKNYYYIKNNALYKKGPEGLLTFSDFQLGPISTIDIINPLKILVFYKNVNTAIFLDNKLNEIERINFNTLSNFVNIGAATNAGNNRLWIFNIDTQQLELFNYRTLQKSIVSQPFSGELISQVSNFNYCYLLTETKLRAFNVYGSLLFEIEVDNYEKMVQQNEKLVVLKDDELFFVFEKSIRPIKIPLSENKIKDLQLTQDLLYIYDGNNILTYSLTQPKQ